VEQRGLRQDDWKVTPRLTLKLGLRYSIHKATTIAAGPEPGLDRFPESPGEFPTASARFRKTIRTTSRRGSAWRGISMATARTSRGAVSGCSMAPGSSRRCMRRTINQVPVIYLTKTLAKLRRTGWGNWQTTSWRESFTGWSRVAPTTVPGRETPQATGSTELQGSAVRSTPQFGFFASRSPGSTVLSVDTCTSGA